MSNNFKIMAERLKQTGGSLTLSYSDILQTTQENHTKNLWEIEQGGTTIAERRDKAYAVIRKHVEDKGYRLDGYSTEGLVERLYNDLEKFSVLTEYLEADNVEGININSWEDIRINFSDGSFKKINGFNSAEHAQDVIGRLLRESGAKMDEAIPMAEASINSNIRVVTLKTPVCDKDVGVCGYIRILRDNVFSETEYLKSGFATEPVLNLLNTAIRRGVSTLIAGRVNTGKTTLVKYLLYNLPNERQIITIESGAREMRLIKRDADGKVANNVVHLLTKESKAEDQNITQEKLVEKALRLNPDVLSVAEIRNVEAHAAVEAAASGHTVISTVHAGNITQTHIRVAILARKKYNMDFESALGEVCRAFPLVVYIHTTEDGVRRIMAVAECYVTDKQKVEYNTLWEFEVKENVKNPDGTITVNGDYVQVNNPSDQLVENLKLYGITEEELNALFIKKKAKKEG